MGANYIFFVNELIYGDSGAAELSIAAVDNHLRWTLANAPTATVSGTAFLQHHVDEMLARYEQWRAKYGLPLVRPWNGSNVFPAPLSTDTAPAVPSALAGGAFPADWTVDVLGKAVRDYFLTVASMAQEMGGDEVKAPYSYRYWAFMKWASDLRKRLLGQPVLPVPIVFDRDGTILSEKDFMDFFNQAHHVWHPGGDASAEPSWTEPTPGFKTSVGQYRGKKKLYRAQIGEEFFFFHREHLELMDRWLARTGQDPIPSLNCCGHDSSTSATSPPPNVNTGAFGLPKVDFSVDPPTVTFNVAHTSIWDGTRPGFDGTLREFSSVGEMGQFNATDFQTGSLFVPPLIEGTDAMDDRGYHGEGHVLNGDLAPPEHNNYSPRFFGWHGYIDAQWERREPRFVTAEPVLADGVTSFPSPRVMTVLRDFATSTDVVEPSNAAESLSLATGLGTLRFRFNVKPDPFARPLVMTLRFEVLREGTGTAPVIALPLRRLSLTPAAPASANERQQAIDFTESFVFDGSIGTVDTDGQGPFASKNTAFTPPNTGFKNSLIRVTATLTSERQPDGSVPATPGTVTSVGTTLTGAGTSFLTTFRMGDMVRVGDEVRTAWRVNSDTELTLSSAFSADITSPASYVWVEGFEHERRIEIPLVQEDLAPDVTVYLDHSTFSKQELDASPAGLFENAFYVLLQDRTKRPAEIVWPSDMKTDVILPQLKGIIAPPVRAAGLYTDAAHAPVVELVELSNVAVPGVTVAALNPQPEDPALHPSVPQRVTYACNVTFADASAFTGMASGDSRRVKLRITARDRAGNTVVDDSTRIDLRMDANPYMKDGPTSWLSTDTRVFKINQGQARFGVASGWTDPNAFIQAVIGNLRAGNGTAGGESFEDLSTDQEQSALEYSTEVNGTRVHNFALSRVRLLSPTGASGVRCTFRLFRWGTANVAFDTALAYRSTPGGLGRLGVTSSNELASIPFFAAGRVPLSDSMDTQSDLLGAFDFGPSGTSESQSFFGAYLDINQSDLRFPKDFLGDGPFNAVPAADMRSIRDLLIGQHQCMVCEVVYAPDPTIDGATPGNSDNLAQRNLLILQTANPGSPSTRMVQHSFDIDVTRRQRRAPKPRATAHGDVAHVHGHDTDKRARLPEGVPPLARPAQQGMTLSPDHAGHGGAAHGTMESALMHLRESWLQQAPELLEKAVERAVKLHEDTTRWQFHESDWRRLDGLDELAFFWNDLPRDSVVEVFIPGCNVEEIINYRNLRHAPDTVRIAGEHTLRLKVAGPTWLPIPAVYGDHLAGLVTVTLPPGIKYGQKFRVDVLQMRSDEERVVGGFQINIKVTKAERLIEPETRTLSLFHQRLGLTAKGNRWQPILARQVEFFRARARGFVALANGPDAVWVDPTERERGQRVRVVLERFQILDDQDPWIKGMGEFRFLAKVRSRDNGGLRQDTRFPERGHIKVSDERGRNLVTIEQVIFEGFVATHLAVEISGVELDTFDPDDTLPRYRRVFSGAPDAWLGAYGPMDDEIDPEDLGAWSVWYRIERA